MKLGNFQLVGQLNSRLDADIFRIVDACGNQQSRSRSLSTKQYMGNMQFRSFYMNVVFDDFARCQFMPSNVFHVHMTLPIPENI